MAQDTVKRTKCPFYGFASFGRDFMIDSEGNQCPLAGGYTPCYMEMARKAPDWKNCTAYNTPDNQPILKRALENTQVFPKELHPKGTREGWEGLPLRTWFDYIVEGKPLFDPLPDLPEEK